MVVFQYLLHFEGHLLVVAEGRSRKEPRPCANARVLYPWHRGRCRPTHSRSLSESSGLFGGRPQHRPGQQLLVTDEDGRAGLDGDCAGPRRFSSSFLRLAGLRARSGNALMESQVDVVADDDHGVVVASRARLARRRRSIASYQHPGTARTKCDGGIRPETNNALGKPERPASEDQAACWSCSSIAKSARSSAPWPVDPCHLAYQPFGLLTAFT